jgi:hypothetical protein
MSSLINITVITVITVITILIFCLLNAFLELRKELFRNNSNNNSEDNSVPPFPIDAVYTWKGEKISNNTRESYNYELKYSLRSIDKFAPWINKIYLLVDAPKIYPTWIDQNNDKIILVDTTETFPDKKYLPNSNSNAIETTITRIPNLSEHYIYFCDDIFLGKPLKYTDFFTKDGKAIIDDRVVSSTNMLKYSNINLLNIKFPPTVSRFYPHVPIPQIKSIVDDFYNKYPDYIDWIRSTKVRLDNGCKVCVINKLICPCQQIHYPICKHMYSKNKAILTNNNMSKKALFIPNNKMYVHDYCILFNIFTIKPMFFCINDDEKDPKKRVRVRKDMLYFFNEYYPDKASFEL